MTKDEIKQAVKMPEILSRYGIKQNRAGFIHCPFHNDKNPSCKIYEDSFYCFTCGAGGDIFTFVMQYEQVPFSAAFTALGGTYMSKKGKARNKIRQEMRDLKTKKKAAQGQQGKVDQAKKELLVYETALKMLEPGTAEWYMCQLNFEKEKAKYERALAETGGDENS